jgi:hypothetical protein
MQCSECRFFKGPTPRTDRGGYCHRFPPQIIYESYNNENHGQITQHFPWMENTEWCGEFRSMVDPRI